MIAARWDRRLNSRVNPSDVLQDVFMDMQRRITEHEIGTTPFLLWLRSITGQRLIDLFRFHLGAQCRAVGREVTARLGPNASSECLSEFFISKAASVGDDVIRAELYQRVSEAIDKLAPRDRELIALRHFERLSNQEAAQVLEMSSSAASTRYIRALVRLRESLSKFMDVSSLVADL